MTRKFSIVLAVLVVWLAVFSVACGKDGGSVPPPPPPPPPGKSFSLAVTKTGIGSGTVASNPAGVNCGTACKASFAEGTTVTLTAVPTDAGSVFAGWFGDCTGMGQCSVTMNADRQVTALFDISTAGDIVFWRGVQTGNTACGGGFCEDIYAMNEDGSGVRQLTADTAQDLDPSWSPDKTKIAFVSNRDKTVQVYVMNADGTKQSRVSPSQYSGAAGPAWAPDGAKIVFVGQLTDTGEAGIAVMNNDGSNHTQLTRTPCMSGCQLPGYVSFSPDGGKITFDFRESGVLQVWIMDADGSNRHILSPAPAQEGNPAWSPDGERISFISTRGGGDFAIWTMNKNGGDYFQVTFPPAGFADISPVWSPDGTKIAFTRTNGSTLMDIYVVSAASGTPQKITSVGFNGYPDWR